MFFLLPALMLFVAARLCSGTIQYNTDFADL